MKKVVKNVVVFALMMMILIGGACTENFIKTHYSRTATVVKVDTKSEEITVIDLIGEEWVFYGEGFLKNDTVKLKMFNNNTDNTFNDDIIEKVVLIKR